MQDSTPFTLTDRGVGCTDGTLVGSMKECEYAARKLGLQIYGSRSGFWGYDVPGCMLQERSDGRIYLYFNQKPIGGGTVWSAFRYICSNKGIGINTYNVL